MIKRKMYKYLINWKQKKDKSALIIKGARQVGKSYLVREFGRNEYEGYIEINFLKNPLYKNIFKGDLSAEEIFKRLSAYIPNLKISSANDVWNLVYLDNNWLHLDLTWDDIENNRYRDNYFLITKEKLLSLDTKEHNFDNSFFVEGS